MGTKASPSFAPGILSPNKVYYWYVVEAGLLYDPDALDPIILVPDTNPKTQGDVWKFTTGSGLPGEPAYPDPLGNATDVSLTPFLLWAPGETSTSQDVYFGTTLDAAGNPPFVQNQSAEGYDCIYEPGPLLPNTTYYWRIDARNSVGLRRGTLWQFKTVAGPPALLSDDFEDGDAAGWTVHNTAWSVATDGSKVYKATNTSGYARASAGSTAWTDQAVEVRVKPVSWSGSNRFALLGARFVDINNYYYVALRSNQTIELKRLKGNSPTTLASRSMAFNTGTWYKVKLEAVGSVLKVYVNDVQQLTATDTHFPSGKMTMGVWNGTAEFDSVQVTDP